MDVSFSIKGDLAVQRRFQTAGDRVRNAVTAAIFLRDPWAALSPPSR